MNITSKQLKQIIREEIERVYSEGFGEGQPADDELSQKRDVYLEDDERTVEPFMVRYVELAKEMVSKGAQEQKIDPQLAKDILSMLAGVEGTGGFEG